LTLLDVLSGFDTLKICVAYRINGNRVTEFPAHVTEFDGLEAEYLELPGWKEDISKLRDYSDLPEQARNYVETIENLLSIKIKYISVGAERNQTIIR